MRAVVLVALVLLVGAFVGGAWWWTSGHEDDALRRSADPAARAETEGAPAPPLAAMLEAQRTKSAEAPIAPTSASAKTNAPPSVRVHVVDGVTRTAITDVTVIRSNAVNAVDHAASPVTVTPGPHVNPVTLSEGFWFIAPGYVRNSLTVEFRDASDRTVELAACGVLLVTIRGELPKSTPPPPKGARKLDFGVSGPPRGLRDPDLRLKYEQAFSGMYRNMPLALGETRIDEVVPGNLSVSVEIGGYPAAVVLASKAVHVEAGETVRVDLDLAPFAMPAAAPLAGTLRVPPGWPDEKLGISISPRGIPGAIAQDHVDLVADDFTPIPGRRDEYRWEAGDVLPGTYAITIRGTETTKVVEVPPTGATDVALEAAMHAPLRVRVVSASDGSPVKLSWLDWTPTSEDGRAAVSPILLLYDEATRTYGSNVPIGRGVLESFGADLWKIDDEEPTEIFFGGRELIARVRPVGGATVDLTVEGNPVELLQRQVDAITVAPVGGSGRCVWRKYLNARLSFAADPPGRYRVTLPEIDGYVTVPPFDVDVAVGKFTPMKFELRRSQ